MLQLLHHKRWAQETGYTDYETDIGVRAASLTKEDFYVDDGLTSIPSEEETIALISETQQMC